MEWTKTQTQPEDVANYIVKEKFNERLNVNETWYYYWVKNPMTIPSKPFRSRSAYGIAEIMSKPSELGMTYIAPIKLTRNGEDYISSFFIDNFDSPEPVANLFPEIVNMEIYTLFDLLQL